MRIQTVFGVLLGTLLVLGFARPAAAQVKVDLAGGYQYFRFVGSYDEQLPAGWAASVAVGKDRVKFVVDVAGNYREPLKYENFYFSYYDNGRQVHTFQGGVEFSGPTHRVVPYARLLTGVGVITTYGNTFSMVFTAEAGAKVMISDRIGAQVSAGFPGMLNAEGSAGGFRFFTGIVLRK